MRTLLVAVLVLLIPPSYGDQDEEKIEDLKDIVKQTIKRQMFAVQDYGSYSLGKLKADAVIVSYDNQGVKVKEYHFQKNFWEMSADLTERAAMWDRVGGSYQYLESSDVKQKREKDIERQKEADDFNGLPYCSARIAVTGAIPIDLECYDMRVRSEKDRLKESKERTAYLGSEYREPLIYTDFHFPSSFNFNSQNNIEFSITKEKKAEDEFNERSI